MLTFPPNNCIFMSTLAPGRSREEQLQRRWHQPPSSPSSLTLDQRMPSWMGSSPRMTPKASQGWLLSLSPNPSKSFLLVLRPELAPSSMGPHRKIGGPAAPSSGPQARRQQSPENSLARGGGSVQRSWLGSQAPETQAGGGWGRGVLGCATDGLPGQAGLPRY